MTYFVKWAFTYHNGNTNPDTIEIKWFENIDKANEYKAYMEKGNGGYFRVLNEGEGNFAEYEEMMECLRRYEELKAKF